MFRHSLSWCLFAFTLLESIIRTHLTVHESNHGFIANNERYLEKDIGVMHEDITSGLRNVHLAGNSLPLRFEPEFLDFKHRPLGVPHLEKVTLFNVDSNNSIDMTSISGSTVHFHSSFFEDKKIPPLGNTSFNVVFLGREEGFVESNLLIHTTDGHFKYNVKGSSVYSPYRLRPIVGIKLPINATFSPLIYMHNPHKEPLQIVEVYSSGGDFHLELPTGDLEGPKHMWELAPLQTKAVIRVRFQANSEQNHTAYVRIKVNSSEEILVVPLEVEVSADAGLFEPQGFIDFGVGGSLDTPKTMDLCMLNPLRKAIRIHSISTQSNAIRIKHDSVKLMPGIKKCAKIGSLTIDWGTAHKLKDFAGTIVVRYRNGRSKAEIPYYLTVLEGGITYDPMATRYFINDQEDDLAVRVFKAKNKFLSPIKVLNCSLAQDARKFFKIEHFKPQVIQPRQEANIFMIKLKPDLLISDLKVNSFVSINTNISKLMVPLLTYNGKLQVHLPFKSKDYSLDMGLVGYNASKEVHFLVLNKNPVEILLNNVKTSIPGTEVTLVGCGKGNPESVLLQVNFQNLTKCRNLHTDSYAVIGVTVQTYSAEGQIWGDVQVETQYETLSVPVHFKVAPGKLEIGPDRLVFDQCFPGKICSHPLRVHSTFNDPMFIEQIISLPPDKRLTSKHSGHILARATKIIGHLYLDPSLECGNECYTGLQHDTTAQWLKTLSLSQSVSDFDLNLVNVFYNRYVNFTLNGTKKWQNLTLRLDTSEVRGHIFKTRVKMSWPSLVQEPQIIDYPLTQIGNLTYRNITVKNPSSYNLVVQLVLDRHYPDLDSLYEGLPSSFVPFKVNNPNRHGFFFAATTAPEEFLVDVEEVSANSQTVLLSPGANFTVTIGFRTEDTVPNSALVLLRNNLTILEVVGLRAQGAHPMFKFGNRKPGSLLPLSFELTEKHLKDCEKEKQLHVPSPPNLTVKRSFTARNIGDVTIYINSFHINDVPCEGYGFNVLNCDPFALHPNRTRKIDIAFTPDLTLSKITRVLILGTSLNYPVNYTVHTTIPPYYLGLCANLIARPPWEMYMSYVIIVFMLLLFLVIILLAVIDSERIKKQALNSLLSSHTHMSTQPVLDLRLVGQQTRAEIRTTSQQKVEEKKCEEAKPVKECEKYSVLVPTVGRSKKKLAKKTSADVANTQNECEHVATTGRKPFEMKNKRADAKKESKKTASSTVVCGKKVTKHTATNVPVYEEESSSITTDCSSNNDENDETKHAKTLKTQSAPKVETPPPPQPVVSAPEETVEVKVHPKVERKRSGQKTTYKASNTKDTSDTKVAPEPLKTQLEPNRKTSQKSVAKERREKPHLAKKLSADKTGFCSKNEPKRESPPVRVSPPITSSVWGENRATFSDVVARNEALNVTTNSRPLAQTQTTAKPTMYVEPYKQTPTELGPIGSRRIDFWQEESNAENQSNSFFSNTPYLNQEGANYLEENWGHNQGLLGLLDGTENNLLTDAWGLNGSAPSSGNHNPYWNSAYTPLAESLQMQQQQGMGRQSGYLWGSSTVWEPWAPPPPPQSGPELPKTPTRTPPGFDGLTQRKRDESPVRPREGYNPFSIWTQQQPNPWNYPGQ